MFRSFFDPESFAWKPFGVIADLIVLSLLWLVCSLPVFTLGAATTALYDATVHSLRFKEREMISRFFRTFKAEFKLASLSLLLLGSIWIGCFLALRWFIDNAAPSDAAFVAAVAGLFLLLLPTGPLCWVFPLLSRFDFGFKTLCVTALKLSMGNLPATLLMAVSLAGSVWLSVLFTVPALVLPALLMLFWSLFTERVFRRYM